MDTQTYYDYLLELKQNEDEQNYQESLIEVEDDKEPINLEEKVTIEFEYF